MVHPFAIWDLTLRTIGVSFVLGLLTHMLEGGDKWVMSKFRQTTILRPFFDIFKRLPKTQNFFFEKLPPCTAKTVFENPKGPPFGC